MRHWSRSAPALLARLMLAALVGLALAGTARAGGRVALVIGIGAYQNAPALDGPVADARAMATALTRLGFDVMEGYDLRLDALRALVGAYAARLDGAGVGLLYYAGHGIAVAGENYLLPTDAVLRNEADLGFRAVSLAQVLRPMQRADRTSIAFLDAARPNPLAADLLRLGRIRPGAVATGLAAVAVEGTPRTLVGLSAEPGRTAPAAPPGRTGPYTAALVAQVGAPGLPLDAAVERAGAAVARATDGAQRPWFATSIPAAFSLDPAAPVAAAAPPAPAPAIRSAPAPAVPAIRPAPAAVPPPPPEPVAAAEPELKLSHKERVEAQLRLKAVGFDPGGASGAFGPGTHKAVGDWQGSRGLPRTGILDAAQRAALWEQSESGYRKLLAARAAAVKAKAAAAQKAGEAPPEGAAPREGGAAPEGGGFLDNLLKAVRR
ncbi:caspase family protein [Methylobacterium sp. NEAU 140]|uniref:caspase family protein n=1 Tax=Methylobacterium sp. NEAU 140 TaxID=3064945 RepID=UPI0027348570|nr:caspase family protein [Methylobacterium sp. NEAU 140]MDP4026376.1 caspase family protein [Methylobacterium sp. NEAU 140]